MREILPPRICPYCANDLSVGYHKLTCRIVADIENIEGFLDIPVFLDRRRATPASVFD